MVIVRQTVTDVNVTNIADANTTEFEYAQYPIASNIGGYALANGTNEIVIKGSAANRAINLHYLSVIISAAANSHLTYVSVENVYNIAPYTAYSAGQFSAMNAQGLANGTYTRLLAYGVNALCAMEVTFGNPPLRALDGTEMHILLSCTGGQTGQVIWQGSWDVVPG